MNPSLPAPEWFGVCSPMVVLSLGAVFLLLMGLGRSWEKRGVVAMAWGLLLVAGSMVIIRILKPYIYTQQLPMGSMFVYDKFAAYFQHVFLFGFLLACVAVGFSRGGERRFANIQVALLLFFCAAVTMLATSADLIALYISGEIAALVVYFLAAGPMEGEDVFRDGRAFIKMGIASSALTLTGLVFLFGMSGSTDLWEISDKLQAVLFSGSEAASSAAHAKAAMVLALILFCSGLLMRMGSFPFQLWSERAYRHMRPSLASMISLGLLGSSLAALSRILWITFIRFSGDFSAKLPAAAVLSVLAVLTLAVGTWKMIRVRDFRTFMAFGSMVHAGFLLMGLATMDREGIEAMMLYLAVYAAMSGGLLILFEGIETVSGESGLEAFEGLGRRSPAAAAAAAVFLFSLAGLPCTAGFPAKYGIFNALFINLHRGFRYLAFVGLAGCLIPAYIYGKLVFVMFFKPANGQAPGGKEGRSDLLGHIIIALFLAALLVAAGIYWRPLHRAATWAMMIIEYEY